MLRTIATIVYVLALSFGLAAAATWAITGRFAGFDALDVAQWTGYPRAGTAKADPYARAWAARSGELILGSAEGLTMIAARDAAGAAISGDCDYLIEGRVPAARLWTLHVTDEEGRLLQPPTGLSNRTHSRAILREADGTFRIALSARAQPGNWLHLDREGPVRFVLTLYDTTIATSVGLTDVTLPTVQRTRCRS